MLKIRIKGMAQAKEALKEATHRVRAGTAKALYVAASAVMTDAKQRAPVGTDAPHGVLRDSGYVTLPEGTSPRVELGFGGPSEPFALIQHEQTEFHHEHGEAKFLEKAVDATPVVDIVEAELKSAVETGDVQVSAGPHPTEPG